MSGANENEFNTNVPDKDDRKQIRRKRIERRGAADEGSKGDDQENNDSLLKSGLYQVSESLLHLDKRKVILHLLYAQVFFND